MDVFAKSSFITWPKNQLRSRGVQNVWRNNLKNKTYRATLNSTLSFIVLLSQTLALKTWIVRVESSLESEGLGKARLSLIFQKIFCIIDIVDEINSILSNERLHPNLICKSKHIHCTIKTYLIYTYIYLTRAYM